MRNHISGQLAMKYTFTKEERLCNKRLIDGLFHNGSSFLCYPYKVSWMPVPAGKVPAQVVFAVPKKRYKHAVDRNLLKRRTREAYRLHKQQFLYDFLMENDKHIALSLVYVGTEIAAYDFIEKKMLKLFVQLCQQIAK
ncbi:ribonuclease P protein component [Mucilaginibacter mali]|uniref:Ribonuclease P protein component n=1 Tax=Mucilaginibacter mali TaxID=2740462 RepID=A0A7D4PVP5_9SPHI|nr:ribonuclease P protein component [Mucilaginibacter mali]QKJ31203.1 ribonuclease P protein component [Mucilaginibacter mali]